MVSWLKELLGLAAGLIVLGIGGVFPGFLDAAREIGAVDIAYRDRQFGQQRAAGRNDIGKAAEYDIAFLAARRRLQP